MTTIKGFKRMEGVSKKTGNRYAGYILYCEDNVVPSDVRGSMCFEKFVGDDALSGEPYVGAQAVFHFDHRGFLQDVEVI